MIVRSCLLVALAATAFLLNFGVDGKVDMVNDPLMNPVPGLRVEDPNFPPCKGYQRGFNGRVEYIQAVVERNNIGKGKRPTQKIRDYVKRMGRQTDDAGHLIAKELGGPGRFEWNFIPQNLTFNRGVWNQKERKVKKSVEKTGRARFTIKPQYNGPRDTRPSSIRYRIEEFVNNAYKLIETQVLNNY